MSETSNFVLNLSILYRNTQKFYDHVMAKHEIGSGQLIFLMLINENEGTTMQEITRLSEVDKGTTTKSINRLIDQGYVQSQMDPKDHRVKRLYTTTKASNIMASIYEYRNQWRKVLNHQVDFKQFEQLLSMVTENSRNGVIEERPYEKLRIGAIQKTSLHDFPGHISTAIYLSGCQYKCPYCNQRNLVYIPENYDFTSPDELLKLLQKRKGLVDSVVITGGEPLSQPDLLAFLPKIKELGYLIKLDTNGYRPSMLKQYCQSGLIDYIAMDIKNIPEKYAITTGMDAATFDVSFIKESVKLIQQSGIAHEFRTTVVQELHTAEDLVSIAEWTGEDSPYFLQQYYTNDQMLSNTCHAYTNQQLEQMLQVVQQTKKNVHIRYGKEGICTR